jgi:hypothetical protein
MDWQEVIALAVVMATAVLWGANALKGRATVRPGGGCHGCCSVPAAATLPAVTVRGRRGQSPVVHIRLKR